MNPAGQPVQLTVKNGQIVNQQRGVVQQQPQQTAAPQQATTPQQQLQQQLQQQQQNAANVQQIFLNSKNQLVMVSFDIFSFFFFNLKTFLVYRSSYRHDWKIFIVAWITYIYVWQRFERHFSHHQAKWIAIFPLYIVLTRELALDIFLPIFCLFSICLPIYSFRSFKLKPIL